MPLIRARAGVALLDLLLALVLFGLVGTVLCHSLLQQTRATRSVLDRVAAGLTLDQAGAFFTAELEGLGHAGPDLLRLATDSLSYRAFRGTGLACEVDPVRVVASLSGVRQPKPGRDSLLLFVARDDVTDSAVAWIAAPIISVRPAVCPGGAALELGTALDTSRSPVSALPPLVPVALFEVMQARAYQSQGQWWLGARSESGAETIQPLAGPFAPAGVTFEYTDSVGAPTLQPARARAIRVDLQAVTPGGVARASLHLRPWNLR